MPLKKRKIVSTQRSAFWPCGSCRRNCKSESICCDACRRWHHTGCEGLTASEFKFFNESDAPYTCNDCSAIEIGNSPYNYENVVTISRYYATCKSDPTFEKKVSYFVRKTDVSMGNIAVFEYKGKQPRVNIPHGNAKSKEEFVRTNPKAFDKIQLKIKKNNQQPREIFADLKQDDSLTCPRDFGVIRSKKIHTIHVETHC